MLIPRYWATETRTVVSTTTEREHTVTVKGWSFTSPEEAVADARERVERKAEEIVLGLPRKKEWNNWYSDRPLCEPILQELLTADGKPSAMVTRNAYGARILNCASAAWVDVDFAKLEGVADIPVIPGEDDPFAREQERTLERLDRWHARHPDKGLRIYRTLKGLRCLLSHQPLSPLAPEIQTLMGSLEADPLYVKLCRMQQCFRARLTPKCWRVLESADRPPKVYPWVGMEPPAAYTQWVERYNQACVGYSSARFVAQLGPLSADPDLAAVLELHDRECGVHDVAPLA